MEKVVDNSRGNNPAIPYKGIYKGPTLGVSGGPTTSGLEHDVKVKRPNGGGSETFITDSQLQESLAVLEHRIVQKLMELSSRIRELEAKISELEKVRAAKELRELEEEDWW